MFKKILEYALIICVAVALSIFLRVFIFEFVQINGESMMNTIEPDEKVLAVKFMEPDRGDIVLVQHGEVTLIKRVIAIEGDTFEIREGHVLINDTQIKEPYIKEDMLKQNYEKITLGPDELFVMGDNRNYSGDSRTFGLFSKEDFRGQVIFAYRFWDKFHLVN